MSTQTIDYTEMNLASVVKVLEDAVHELEQARADLHRQAVEMEDSTRELEWRIADLQTMHEEIPESLTGADAHAALVTVADAAAGADLYGLTEAREAIARAERGLASLAEAVTAAHKEFTAMQHEYADARVTDATAWHTTEG